MVHGNPRAKFEYTYVLLVSHLSKKIALGLAFFIIATVAILPSGSGWDNGGYSSDPNNPPYGTHDFLAQHALDFLPTESAHWLRENMKIYLYGTELPDNSNAPLGDGIGDKARHHVYYYANGQLQDDSEASRAKQTYQQTLGFLAAKDFRNAAKWMGVTTHYVDDLGSFGHVMGNNTDWGNEVHHQDYEDWANSKSNAYDAPFKSCLNFDGGLEQVTAYDAALKLAHDTTFDDTGKGHTAKWMDTHFNESDPAFDARVCESLNSATNLLADLIYSAEKATQIPELNGATFLIIVMLIVAVSVLVKRGRFRPHSVKNARGDHSGPPLDVQADETHQGHTDYAA